jgi:hypothetical protein
MKVLFRQIIALTGLFWASFAMAVEADTDAAVVLTVRVGEDAGPVQYSLADLRAMPVVSFETSTIWTSGAQRFTGVSLAQLAALAGAKDGWIEAHALNEYAVEIPLSDAVEGGAIVAYERNGQAMSRRGKGPLWIVYPFDSKPEYRTEKTYTRSIWQLNRIVFHR